MTVTSESESEDLGAPSPCLYEFLCGTKTAGAKEHVMQAALGGRRTNKNLVCKACEVKLNVLDEILPIQLRLLNTLLGVRGDHTGRAPVPARVKDPTTGSEFLLDQHLGIRSPDPTLGESGIFTHVSEEASARELIAKKRREGFKVELLTTTPFFLRSGVRSPISLGSEIGMRAVGRFALNVLATNHRGLSRSKGLEPFKRWIFEGGGEPHSFCAFGEVMPTGTLPESSFEFGHRVVLGFNGDGGAFARVSFFDCGDFVLQMGTVEVPPNDHLIVDFDPLAPFAWPDRDFRTTQIVPVDVGVLVKRCVDSEQFSARFCSRLAEIARMGRDRERTAMLGETVA